jgi:hypothetical protein
VHEVLPARARPGQLDAVLQLLAHAPDQPDRTDLESALAACAERVGRRGLIVLASDLLDMSPTALDPLTRMRALGHDVIVLHVMHPHEIDFPYHDRARFADPESDETMDSDPDAVRDAYKAELSAFLVGARQRCTAAGARYVLARSDEPPQEAIAEAVTARARRAWA